MKEWLWKAGGMIVTRESRSIRRKAYSIIILSITNSTHTELELNPAIRDEISATNRLSHAAAMLPVWWNVPQECFVPMQKDMKFKSAHWYAT
jgi:hypothetical protein